MMVTLRTDLKITFQLQRGMKPDRSYHASPRTLQVLALRVGVMLLLIRSIQLIGDLSA